MKLRSWTIVCSVFSVVPCGIAGTSSYRDLILGDDPIVYYELDEDSGTTTINSAATGVTYEGAFDTSGGPITVGQASFPGGGSAYAFGGGFVGAASGITKSLEEWTVEAWVNYDAEKGTASNFLSNDQGGWNDDVLIGIGAENGAVGVPRGSVGVIQQGSPGTTRDFAGVPLAPGEWHHIVVTGSTSSGVLSLYVDGFLVASDTDLVNGVTFNGADGIGLANLTIGAARPDSADPGYRFYDGLLDEVAVYDTVLDAATISRHFEVGTGAATGLSITSFSSVGAGVWEVALSGSAGAEYQFRSSTALDFTSAVLIENLTQGDPADPGTIGGVNDSVVTTDANGNALVRMELASAMIFLRAREN